MLPLANENCQTPKLQQDPSVLSEMLNQCQTKGVHSSPRQPDCFLVYTELDCKKIPPSKGITALWLLGGT